MVLKCSPHYLLSSQSRRRINRNRRPAWWQEPRQERVAPRSEVCRPPSAEIIGQHSANGFHCAGWFSTPDRGKGVWQEWTAPGAETSRETSPIHIVSRVPWDQAPICSVRHASHLIIIISGFGDAPLKFDGEKEYDRNALHRATPKGPGFYTGGTRESPNQYFATMTLPSVMGNRSHWCSNPGREERNIPRQKSGELLPSRKLNSFE